MFEPDWKAFARLTWTADMLPVLDALGVVDAEIPQHGRPRRFAAVPLPHDETHRTVEICEGDVFVVYSNGQSTQVGNGDDVLDFLRLRRYYRNDKALRRWLALWGWTPPANAPAAAPPPPPMVM